MKFSESQIKILSDISIKAGEITLKYHKNLSSFEEKKDGSEVTIADQESNEYICENLKKHFPEIPIISEEGIESENLEIVKKEQYFIIDPLDGTKDFIKGGDHYTINIAYVENKIVEIGFIYLPVLDYLYFNDSEKSYKKIGNNISEIKSSNNTENLNLIATKREPEKSDIENWAKENSLSIKETLNVSSSYKFCLVAEGKADIYPRMVNIKSWDIAAGVSIINKSEGKVINRHTNNDIIFDKLEADEFIAFNNKISLK